MKILFYFGGFAPVGGIETFARNLLVDQRRRGNQARLLCWGPASELLRELRSKAVSVHRNRMRWGCRWHLPDWWQLLQGVREVGRTDLVIFGKLLPAKILQTLRRAAKNVPFIFITPYRPVVPGCAAERQQLCAHLQFFDEIWVQGASFADDLKTIGYSGITRTVPYMPEADESPERCPSMPLRIGFLGRLVPDKNLPLLLDALCLLSASSCEVQGSIRDFRVEIIGDGPMREALQQRVVLAGLEQRTIFRGAIPQRLVREAVSGCHLFVFTSDVEGQCLAALEIFRAGRPVVATDAGAFPDMLRDDRLGALVSDRTPVCVADAICSVAKRIISQDIRHDTVYSAYLERFGMAHLGKQYAALFESVSVHIGLQDGSKTS